MSRVKPQDSGRGGVRIGRLGPGERDPVSLVRRDARLRESPLVQALGEAALSVLAEARVLRVSAGTELLDSASPPSDLLLVRQGRLSVLSAGGGVPVEEVGPGEVVGCAAALGQQGPGLTIIAAEATELVAIPGRALGLAAALMPDLRGHLEQVLSERTRRVGEVDAFLERW